MTDQPTWQDPAGPFGGDTPTVPTTPVAGQGPPPYVPPGAPPYGMGGTPPPPGRGPDRGMRVFIGVAIAVIVVAAAIAVFALTRSDDDDRADGDRDTPRTTADRSPATSEAEETTTTQDPAPTTTEGDGGGGVIVTLPTTSTSTTRPSGGGSGGSDDSGGTGSAESELRDTVAGDVPTVELTVENLWVAQLSTKWPGLEADGNPSWTYDDILAEHETLRSRYGALLLFSSDWGFQRQGVYVTIHDQAFSSAQAANAWCDAQGFDADHCFAKLIHRGPQRSGDTVSRG